jgi:hypothetical protein
MTGQMSQDPKRSDESREPADTGEYGNAGAGAASALERMKSEHARRHKRQHGRSVWPPGEDERDGRHEKGN